MNFIIVIGGSIFSCIVGEAIGTFTKRNLEGLTQFDPKRINMSRDENGTYL